MDWIGLDWTGLGWTRFVKHGFVRGGFANETKARLKNKYSLGFLLLESCRGNVPLTWLRPGAHNRSWLGQYFSLSKFYFVSDQREYCIPFFCIFLDPAFSCFGFVKPGFVKPGFVKPGFVKHGPVRK